jgi:hypothetical protein
MTCLLNPIREQKKELCQPNRDLGLSRKGITSPWRNPLPVDNSQKSPVVVYFYSNRWIAMKCFSLAEAIALYRKALSLGKQIIVYPANLDPYIEGIAIPPCEEGIQGEVLSFIQ